MIELESYPTPQDIEALMRRAREERARAIAAMFAHAHKRAQRSIVVLRRRFLVSMLRFTRIAGDELRCMS